MATAEQVNASAWPCPLGRNKNGSCRGGRYVDEDRLGDSLKETGEMYKDAGECALRGSVDGVLTAPRLSFPEIAEGAFQSAGECGVDKGYVF